MWQNSSEIEKYFRQICRESQNTHFTFSIFFPPELHAVYEIMWKNMTEAIEVNKVRQRKDAIFMRGKQRNITDTHIIFNIYFLIIF